MIRTKADFLEGRLLSSQSEQSKKFLKSSDSLEKSRPSKKPPLFWSCKQVINAVSHIEAKHSTHCGGPAWRNTCKQSSFCVEVVWQTQSNQIIVQHLAQTKKKIEPVIWFVVSRNCQFTLQSQFKDCSLFFPLLWLHMIFEPPLKNILNVDHSYQPKILADLLVKYFPLKGPVQCFTMQIVILNPKKIGTNPSYRFREKCKNCLTPTHSNSGKNDVTDPKARPLW